MSAIPPKLVEQLIEDHGRNTALWPSELQDLVDPSISAKQLNPPLSGQIERRLNRNFEYFWAKDVCGANPDHTRVEELRYVGWDFATTEDVRMCSEETVKGRDKKGFSNEIRSGDRRLMKIPMQKWREMRKSQNVQALQMAYPQVYSSDGKPMTARNLIPGVNTREVGVETPEMKEWESRRVISDPAKEIATEQVFGNTAVYKREK
jgi:hypothetical protein